MCPWGSTSWPVGHQDPRERPQLLGSKRPVSQKKPIQTIDRIELTPAKNGIEGNGTVETLDDASQSSFGDT